MKNVNSEITKASQQIIELYEKVKQANRSDFPIDSNEYDTIDNDDNAAPAPDEEDPDEQVDAPADLVDTGNSEPEPSMELGVADVDGVLPLPQRTTTAEVESQPTAEDLESEIPEDLLRTTLWKGLTGADIKAMLDKALSLPAASRIQQYEAVEALDGHAFDTLAGCHYSLGLDENLEFYFGATPVDDSDLGTLPMSPRTLVDAYNRSGNAGSVESAAPKNGQENLTVNFLYT